MTEEKTKSNKENTSKIGSVVTWLKIMAAAFGLTVTALLLVGVIYTRNFEEQRARDRDQDSDQLLARIIEGCKNFNRDKTDDRHAAHIKVFALGRLFIPQFPPEDQLPEEFKERLKLFDEEMANLYVYRKCDPKCAVSYTNKDIPDCPPSDNEEGT